MKRTHIILLIIIVVTIGLAVFIKYLIIGKKLEISFITSQKHISKDLEYSGCLNYYEWIIIKGKIQKENLEEEGYIIPDIDFSKNYLIISRYKILKLYKKIGINKSLGVPNGHVVFDKENSHKDCYYFYQMPKIMLSQGVG